MIAAVILAAGSSSRFGENKLLLPFGDGTVISTVMDVIRQSAARPIVVVTGHDRLRIESALAGRPAMMVHNSEHATGEMLSSIQAALRHLQQSNTSAEAALIIMGDQPLVQTDWVNRLIDAFERRCGDIIAPRFRPDGPRGHPVLIGRRMWPDILVLPSGANPRDLLTARRDALAFVVVNTDAILLDVDTHDAYEKAVERRRTLHI